MLRELEKNEVLNGKNFFHLQQDVLIKLMNTKTSLEVVAFLELFVRHYWTRVWIVQEIYLAHDFYILCGS